MAQPLFAVLGPVEVTGPDGGRGTPAGRKQRELLALLLLHRNRASTADRLANDLWPRTPPMGAEVTLRSHVSHLRRWLTEAGTGDVLATGPGGYTLVLAPGQVDADRFETLAGRGQDALGLGDAQRAAADLRAALALWRGQPYAELQEVEVASVEAARLEEIHLVALETVAAAELASGRHREVVSELQQLVATHPFRERFCALLMVAMYRSGRQADALAAYETSRERLAEELGLDPGPELRELSQAILRQDPVVLGDAQPPPPPRGAPWPARPATGPPDAVLAAAARVPMAGRDVETRQLEAAWSAVVEGGRRLFLLSGEAGIGKTRLTAGLVAMVAGQGHTVLVGRCEDTGLPYQPVVAALRSGDAVVRAAADAPAPVRSAVDRLLGGAAHLADSRAGEPDDEQRLGLYAAVAFVVARVALDRPLLLVVENAEHIDRASSLLLRHLVGRLPAATAVVVSYRDPPGGRHLPLLELLGDAGSRDLTERVFLGPLSEPETADLVRNVLPDADPVLVRRVWQHTGGNPYFATELTRALAVDGRADGAPGAAVWPVPSGVRDVLRHRLLQLGEPARDALAGAAVLGSDVDFALLADVLQAGEEQVVDALDEAVSAGLLVESGRSWAGRYAFPHELMREAVLADLPAPRSRRLHLRAARTLASQPQVGGTGAAAVVIHLRGAGPAADRTEAVEWSQRAAREASALYAWDEAVEYADGAVDLLERASPGQGLAEVAVTAAALRLRSSRGFDRAVRLLETALREYVATGDDAGAGRVHSRLGGALSLHHSVMDIPRALDHFDAAEHLLEEPDKAFYVNRGRSQAAMFGLRTETLSRSADRAAELAEQLGRRDLAVTAAWGQAWAALNSGRLAVADQLLERSWRTAHELADPYLGWIPVNSASMMANVYVLDPATARSWCRRGLRQPRFTTFAFSHDAVLDQLVLALAASGELEAAREAVVTLPSDAVARRVVTFLEGDWEGAEAEWAAALSRDEAAGDLHDAALNARWLATARRALGDRTGAVTALERALALGIAGPQVPTELAARAELAQLLAADDPSAAEGHLARCEEILAAGADWRGSAGHVELARAAVATAVHDHQLADAQVARAIERFTSYGLAWHRAAALRTWSRLLARRGQRDQAAERRRQAEQAYADLGAADRWRTLEDER